MFCLQLLILCCLLKLGSTIFFLIPICVSSSTAHKVPGVAACTSPCTAQSYRHTQRRSAPRCQPEVPRAGLSRAWGQVWCGAAWLQTPRGAGLSLGPMDTQRESSSSPRGSKGQSSAMRWPSSSMGHILATPGPPSEPFVEVDSLQLWVFLPDLILDFRLQAAHRH